MFFRLKSAGLGGLEAIPVDIEVDINKGQTAFNIVGLADTSIQEARERIHSALKNSGFSYPFNFRVLINLAPGDVHKEGSSYDLPMALGIVAITNQLKIYTDDSIFAGELALDGSVRHVNGILPLAIYAKEKGFKRIFVPESDAAEAALAQGPEVYPVKNLRQLVAFLLNKEKILIYNNQKNELQTRPIYEIDMINIKGQEFAKRALETAAAGSHNLVMSGPPGSGKTLLARALPSILPNLTPDEVLEITKIYSVGGLLNGQLINERPFRTPHHTSSSTSLVGGGRVPKPGEISLAHRGVLFLDELPEFSRFVLESLRQPLEDGIITIGRAQGTVTYPARFIMVGSMNPCPCGFSSDPERQCICSAAQIVGYKKKISGPLLDRMDLQVEVPRLPFEKLSTEEKTENSEIIRARVEKARQKQTQRFKNTKIKTNSEMGNHEIHEFCKLDNASVEILKQAVTQLHLSARSYHRILKVARTIADLEDKDSIEIKHLAEALQFRPKVET